MGHSKNLHNFSIAGALVTLGIIFGDIGTSPLYVMKAIIDKSSIDAELIYGGVSCVFWTLTIQTTIKYVILTLNADNNGEGGIFSLYALVRRTRKWLIFVAILGGAMLLADGIITPAISVSSAVEGLRIINPEIPTVGITMFIITLLFLIQRYGTSLVGKYFGPVMTVWFLMLAVLGVGQIIHHPEVLRAMDPRYAFEFLTSDPHHFWLLGAVFLCTTGGEALYSDLGHCGRSNIRVSWVFVKICLLLNYFGQAAWGIEHQGEYLIQPDAAHDVIARNPFYEIVPPLFLYPSIAIATMAAVIASQALITGSFTLVSEAIRLHLFPKIQIFFPSSEKGQIYIPLVNTSLWVGCLAVVWHFQESSAMEAAYGLAITLTMLMTTILLLHYLWLKRVHLIIRIFISIVYFAIEGAFLVANLDKFPHGGYVTVFIAAGIAFLMWVFLRANKIKTGLLNYVKINDYTDQLRKLSIDEKEEKTATNLVYLSTARNDSEVEQNIIYSILQNQPKRADYYWFVHIESTDEPYTREYKVRICEKDDVIRVRFRLGFKVQPKLSLFMRIIAEEMVKSGELKTTPHYHLLNQDQIAGDFKFIIIEEELSHENDLPYRDKVVLNTYTTVKSFTASPDLWFGLDAGFVTTEKVPLVIAPAAKPELQRIMD